VHVDGAFKRGLHDSGAIPQLGAAFWECSSLISFGQICFVLDTAICVKTYIYIILWQRGLPLKIAT
jgi:hypothetical protein